MKFTINVRDYLTDSEVKEMISNGIRDAIYYQFRNENEKLRLFMGNLAYECLFDAVSG